MVREIIQRSQEVISDLRCCRERDRLSTSFLISVIKLNWSHKTGRDTTQWGLYLHLLFCRFQEKLSFLEKICGKLFESDYLER